MNIVIILLVMFSVSSFGQSTDHTKWPKELNFETEFVLNEEENCLVRDTNMHFHACHDYHGEDFVLIFYHYDCEFCDSFNLVLSKTEGLNMLRERKAQLEKHGLVKRIRLIPDLVLKNNRRYSPEAFFKLELNYREYIFDSIITNWEISAIELENGIEIKERIPNAFINYDNMDFKLTILSENATHVLATDKKFISFDELLSDKKDPIKFIQIEIPNKCLDVLVMNFTIIN